MGAAMTTQTTDLDRWKLFLADFGIEYREEHGDQPGDPVMRLCMEKGMRKVAGYSGFVTDIEFDADGKFIQLGAWE
jgi:hypothetical protein